MADGERCPNCGAEMQANAPQGLCTACLLRQGLESEGTDRPSSSPPNPSDPDLTKTFQPGPEFDFCRYCRFESGEPPGCNGGY
jgi:hypothetical protein